MICFRFARKKCVILITTDKKSKNILFNDAISFTVIDSVMKLIIVNLHFIIWIQDLINGKQ